MRRLSLAFLALPFLVSACNCDCAVETLSCYSGQEAVVILVDPTLRSDIGNGLGQFEFDLCAAGYVVYERTSAFASPSDLRAYLADLYDRTGETLVGAILIGSFPHAYQYVELVPGNPTVPGVSEEAISFQYYADLDGTFAASSSYSSPGERSHSFDTHSGDTDWEIWVGVLPYYKGTRDSTIAGLNRYFDKNHAYRTGQNLLSRQFLQINEHAHPTSVQEHQQTLANMTSGTYSWRPFSEDPGAQFYFDSPTAGLTVSEGYDSLTQGVADFTVTDTHGNWQTNGQLNISWVETNPVLTTFFWSNGCAVGDLDHADNFLSSTLYSPTSIVLVAKGTTNDSGGMGNNVNGFFGRNIATAMSSGDSFGQSLLNHVNAPLVAPWSQSREFHYATVVVLGDPSLRLPQP